MAARVPTLTLLVIVALEIVVAGQEYIDNATTPCCPTGYYVSSDGTNCLCDTIDDSAMPCQPEKLTVELKVGYCLFIDYYSSSDICSQEFLFPVYCPYYASDVPMANRMFMKVPQYATQTNLSDYFCSGLNREGDACMKCKKGYGPAVYSMELACGECSHSGAKMVALLALNIIPTTLLFVIIMVFRVSAASGAMLVYVLHSQLVWLTARSLPFIYKPMNEVHPVVKYLNVFSVIVGGIWSLDYFRPLIPTFCVQPFHSNFLVMFTEFIPAVLFLFLLIASYVGIKLHSRNFTPIVVLCNPFHRLLIKLERNYDSKASVINVFTTFMLLSSSRSMVAAPQLVISFFQTSTDFPSGPTLYCFLAFIIFLWLFGLCIPVCLLILFSFKTLAMCFQCCMCMCCNRTRQGLRAFIEIVTGSYKDGTGNTWNFRYVPSLLIILFISCFSLTGALYTIVTHVILIFSLIFFSTSLFFALCRPCKDSHTNTVASLILFCTAFQNLVLFLWIDNLDISTAVLAYSYALLVSLPQVSFVCYVVYHILKCIPAVRQITETAVRRCQENRAVRYLCLSDYEPLTGDSLPDRLENSVQYRHQLATNNRATPATGGRQDTHLHTTATYGAM